MRQIELDNFHSFTSMVFRQQIFYWYGVPNRSGLLSPLVLSDYEHEILRFYVPFLF